VSDGQLDRFDHCAITEPCYVCPADTQWNGMG